MITFRPWVHPKKTFTVEDHQVWDRIVLFGFIPTPWFKPAVFYVPTVAIEHMKRWHEEMINRLESIGLIKRS